MLLYTLELLLTNLGFTKKEEHQWFQNQLIHENTLKENEEKKNQTCFHCFFFKLKKPTKAENYLFSKMALKEPAHTVTKTLETSAKISLPQKVSTKEVKILVKLFLQSREMKSPPFFSIII